MMGEVAWQVCAVPGETYAVPLVRRWFRRRLGDLPGEVVDRVELIASEFVTNAIQHSASGQGDGQVEIRLGRAAGHVRLEVRDDGPAARSTVDWRDPADVPDYGRGLDLVAAVADDMGAEPGLFWAVVKL